MYQKKGKVIQMRRVADNDVILMNQLYLKFGTYSRVAKETGFSASTVKKYIIPNFRENLEIVKFDASLISSPARKIKIEEVGELCMLSENEFDEIYEFKNNEVAL